MLNTVVHHATNGLVLLDAHGLDYVLLHVRFNFSVDILHQHVNQLVVRLVVVLHAQSYHLLQAAFDIAVHDLIN